MALAKCVKKIWDSQTSKLYTLGAVADIDRDSPLAKYFRFETPETPPPKEVEVSGEGEEVPVKPRRGNPNWVKK